MTKNNTIFTLLLIIISLFSSCSNRTIEEPFKFPKIEIRSYGKTIPIDSLTFINEDSLREQSSGGIIGVYPKEIENIKIEDFSSNERLIENLDFDTVLFDGLQIKIDTSQLIINPFDYNVLKKKNANYPLALLNETNQAKAISTISNRLLMIQEIYYDKYYTWLPINQPFIMGMCGQDYASLILEPNEYVLLNVPIYEGEDLVKMRIKILTGGNVITSAVYSSKINLSQINLPKNSIKNHSEFGRFGERFADFLPFLKHSK